MLVIKVELWPGGSADRAREIGRIGLANVSNLQELSDYVYVAKDDRGAVHRGEVKGHPRSAGFWKLLQRIAGSASRGGGHVRGFNQATLDVVEGHMETESSPPTRH